MINLQSYRRDDLHDPDRAPGRYVQLTAPANDAPADAQAGLVLVASVDDSQVQEVGELKQQIRQVVKRITPTSEPRASIESGKYTMQSVALAFLLPRQRQWQHTDEGNSYVLNDNLCYIAITEKPYPKKLALTFLEDVRAEFQTSYKRDDYLSLQLRPYQYSEFERFIDRTKKTYQDSRATDNLGRLNDELKDVTQVMTKNIEDLLYRGDSLEKMGDMSSRLREDSAKYKRAAVRINWELLLKQYGPFAGLGLVILLLLVWRFW
ncbi:SNAP receptor [Elasticomyces elasticus]|nr:SNAP receptor [Elasticomyces elasticus]